MRKTVIVGKILKSYLLEQKQAKLLSQELQRYENFLSDKCDAVRKKQILAKVMDLERAIQLISLNAFLIHRILSFVQKENESEDYELFKKYFFEDLQLTAISERHRISVNRVSVKINKCCDSFLFY